MTNTHPTDKRPFTVGLTGGIGSGKSIVAEHFRALGAHIIDADEISHAVTQPNAEGSVAIRVAFGDDVFRADGSLNRAALREIVFHDPARKQQLESILHPLIRTRMQAALHTAADAPYVIWMVPLLVESASSKAQCDRVLVVDCPEETQIARVQQRSGLTREMILRVMAAQATRVQRLAAADDVIDNSGDIAEIAPQVATLDKRYRALAHARAA